MKKEVMITLDQSLHKEFKKAVEERKETVSGVVEEMIKMWLSIHNMMKMFDLEMISKQRSDKNE